jgi:hypothetical protein
MCVVGFHVIDDSSEWGGGAGAAYRLRQPARGRGREMVGGGSRGGIQTATASAGARVRDG